MNEWDDKSTKYNKNSSLKPATFRIQCQWRILKQHNMISLATIVGVLSGKIEQYFLQVQFLQNMILRHIYNSFWDVAKKLNEYHSYLGI